MSSLNLQRTPPMIERNLIGPRNPQPIAFNAFILLYGSTGPFALRTSIPTRLTPEMFERFQYLTTTIVLQDMENILPEFCEFVVDELFYIFERLCAFFSSRDQQAIRDFFPYLEDGLYDSIFQPDQLIEEINIIHRALQNMYDRLLTRGSVSEKESFVQYCHALFVLLYYYLLQVRRMIQFSRSSAPAA